MAGSQGTYELTGGSAVLSTNQTDVGYAGTGRFKHSAGTHSVSDTLVVGSREGSDGGWTGFPGSSPQAEIYQGTGVSLNIFAAKPLAKLSWVAVAASFSRRWK
jgi:hypothetical protein